MSPKLFQALQIMIPILAPMAKPEPKLLIPQTVSLPLELEGLYVAEHIVKTYFLHNVGTSSLEHRLILYVVDVFEKRSFFGTAQLMIKYPS